MVSGFTIIPDILPGNTLGTWRDKIATIYDRQERQFGKVALEFIKELDVCRALLLYAFDFFGLALPERPRWASGSRRPMTDSHSVLAERRPPATVSVVVPVYGCVGCLQELCGRLTAAVTQITPSFEILLVDDRSPDGSWDAILRLQEQFPSVRGIRLSRNFGQHIAITAGLSMARGDCAVVLDCDLQDPPEKIPALIAKLGEGYDLVLARRVERAHSLFRLLLAKAYFALLSRLNDERIDGSYGTFSVLSRKVIDGFLCFGERERHYLFILRWLGFRVGTIEYEHKPRLTGSSSYSLGRLIRHAVDGVFFQATVFLRWIVGLGFLFSASGTGLAVYFIYQYFVHGAVAGWTSVAVLILVCTGVIISSMGVIGLYIGKIFDQAKGRPLFVIDSVTGDGKTWGTRADPLRQP